MGQEKNYVKPKGSREIAKRVVDLKLSRELQQGEIPLKSIWIYHGDKRVRDIKGDGFFREYLQAMIA